jgi:PST family polysaccharide transporter
VQAQAKKAHLWLLLDVLGGQGIPFFVFLVMASVIGPGQYGQFVLVMSFVGPLNVVLHRGLADALIRADELDEGHTSTAFWMNMTLAGVIFLLIQALAGWLSTCYRAPEIEAVLRWIALLAPLQALISVQEALARRSLETSVLARRTFLGRSLGGLIGIALALSGAEIWSLVVLQLLQASVSVWVLWRADPWRPRLIFDLRHASALARFGSHYIGGSVVTSLGNAADSLIVGLFFNPAAVGFYVLAARLFEMASVLLLTPMRLLAMPVLSRVTGPEEFAQVYATMVRAALVLWMPAILVLAACARVVLPVLFGQKWTGAVEIVEAMSLAAFTMPLWFFVGEALAAAGRSDMYFRLAAARLIVLVGAVAVGAHFGLVGAGLGWSATSACMVPLAFFALRRACNVNWRVQVSSALRIAVAGVGLIVCVLLIELTLTTRNGPAWFAPLIEAGLGSLAYAAMLELWLMPRYVSDGLKSLKQLVVPPGRAIP